MVVVLNVVLIVALAVVIVLLSIQFASAREWKQLYMRVGDSVAAYAKELRQKDELINVMKVQLDGLSSASVVSREEFDRLRIEYEAKSRKLAEILSIVNS